MRHRGHDLVAIHGPALRFVRQTRRQTAAQLAGEVGVRQSYISMIELGQRRRVSAPLFQQLVAVLDVDPRVLTPSVDGRTPAA